MTKKTHIDVKSIHLVEGKGSKGRGGDPDGFYWHIYVDEKRVGYVFVNVIEDEILGKHPSLQIHINKGQRGKGIGQVAYRLACEASSYPKVFAHMRKSNIASRAAAKRAGFKILNNKRFSQLVMVWERH
jgi:RimJ/RimL family protein N-acetyltransferase